MNSIGWTDAELRESAEKSNEVNDAYKRGYEQARKEFERSQGEWVYHTDDYIVFYTCSNCKGYGDIQDKFCKHCGAEMRKGDTNG